MDKMELDPHLRAFVCIILSSEIVIKQAYMLMYFIDFMLMSKKYNCDD